MGRKISCKVDVDISVDCRGVSKKKWMKNTNIYDLAKAEEFEENKIDNALSTGKSYKA